jgi:hypothetical protein
MEKHCKNGADIYVRIHVLKAMSPMSNFTPQYERNPISMDHRLECIYGITPFTGD